MLDSNKDGSVTREEFCDEAGKMGTGLSTSDLAQIYDALDQNKTNNLKVHEFGMYVQGAKMTKEQMKASVTPSMRAEIHDEIRRLFELFDKDKDGSVTRSELSATLRAFGYDLSVEQVQAMVKQVDKRGTGSIDLQEFT
jgi:Ca2+-binding EF-hand superfamily protein